MFYKVTVQKEEKTNATRYIYPEYDGEICHKNRGSNVAKDTCIWECDKDIGNGTDIIEVTETEKDDLLATWQAEKDALNTDEEPVQ